MSDYDSSLPVRTQNDGDVVVKISDATITSQQLTVNADGSINITDNGGSITVDGTVSVSNLPATVDTNYGAVGANTIRTAAQIGNATGAADFDAGATGAQTLRTEANQGAPALIANAWPTKVTDGTDTLEVNADGSINVNVTATASTHVNDYATSSAVAAAASVNHDYTVTALKTLHLNQIEAAGSGKTKLEVKVETGVASGVFNTRFVQFNSTADPSMSLHLDNDISVAAGVRVRLVLTNKDNQAQDLYSTISGFEV